MFLQALKKESRQHKSEARHVTRCVSKMKNRSRVNVVFSALNWQDAAVRLCSASYLLTQVHGTQLG